MLVQLVNLSYNIADTFWLSRYGEVAYAAPRQVWPSFMLINAVTQGLMAANMAMITQYIGAKMYEDARRVVSYFISATLLLNAILATAFFALRPYIFTHIVRTPAEIYEDVLNYAGIITVDMLLSAVTLSYSTILQSIGDTRTPARVNAIAAGLNIVLDPLLILGVRVGEAYYISSMGVIGAAIATVFSRAVGALVLLLTINRRYPFIKPRFTMRIPREWFLMCFKVGAPVALLMATNSLAFMIQNGLINSFGVYTAAAASIGFILMDLADAVLWGFTGSTAIMVGQALGANMLKRAKDVAIRSSLYIGGATLAGAVAVWFSRDFFIEVFTSNPIIIEKAVGFITTFLPSLPFFAVFMVGMSIGRGSGHTALPTVIAITRLWGIRILLGYSLANHLGMGEMGLWIAMAASNIIGGVLMFTWLVYAQWNKSIIKKARGEQDMSLG